MVADLSATSVLVSVLWLAALDLAAWNLGTPLFARARRGRDVPVLERTLFAIVLGFTLIGTTTFLLACAKLLYPKALVVGFGALALHALLRIVRSRGAWRAWRPSTRGFDAYGAVALGYLACFLPVCLIPRIPHDSLVYHLALPELYLSHHGFVLRPYDVADNMPHYVELLFAPALAGGG